MGKIHTYEAADVTRSVLHKATVTALCGYSKILTREDVDKAQNAERRLCIGCSRALAETARTVDVNVRKPEGWTRHLERDAAERQPYTVAVNGKAVWTYTFPLGA